jgi:hypothetical protein
MNKIKYDDEPLLFDVIDEFSIDSEMEHIRGSNFYRADIIELTINNKKCFPAVKDFEKYIGTWRTNQYIWYDNYGSDESISELTKVYKKEKISYEWIEIKD